MELPLILVGLLTRLRMVARTETLTTHVLSIKGKLPAHRIAEILVARTSLGTGSLQANTRMKSLPNFVFSQSQSQLSLGTPSKTKFSLRCT